MRTLLLIPFLLASQWLFAQSFHWGTSIGVQTSGEAEFMDIAVDDSGNVYAVGSYRQTIDVDPGPMVLSITSSNATFNDMLVTKQDSSGNLIWYRDYGTGTGRTLGHSIDLDSNGNPVIMCYFNGHIDFNPGSGVDTMTSAYGLSDLAVMKLSSSGTFQFVKRWKMTDYMYTLSSVELDAQDNIYICGEFKETIDLDPGPGVATAIAEAPPLYSPQWDIMLVKLDPIGNYLWGTDIGDEQDDYNPNLAVTDSAVYVFGKFAGTVDFDPDPNSTTTLSSLSGPGVEDLFIAKYHHTGDFEWVRQVSDLGETCSSGGIDVDPAGKVYIVANATTDWILDGANPNGIITNNSAGYHSMLIARYTSNGAFEWAKKVEGGAGVYPNHLSINNLGEFFISGRLLGSGGPVNFDIGGNGFNLTPNNEDAFIAKYRGNGDFDWATNLSSTYPNFSAIGQGIRYYPGGKLYGAGFFLGEMDIDPTSGVSMIGNSVLPNPYRSGYVFKWSECLISYETLDTTGCDAVQVFGKTITQSGTSLDTVYTGNCGALWAINSTILQSSDSNLVFTSCDSFSLGMETFYASTSFNDTIINGVGCDSVLHYTITINTSLHDTIAWQGCEPYTSASGITYDSSGVYAESFLTQNQCDSIITYDLSITYLNTSIVWAGDTLVALQQNTTLDWLDCINDTLLSYGSVGQTFYNGQNGVYAAVVSSGVCVDTSSCYEVIIGGISEPSLNTFHAWPNPSADEFYLQSEPHIGTTEALLFNSVGALISRWKIDQHIISFGSELSPGLYLLQLRAASTVQSIQLIKQ